MPAAEGEGQIGVQQAAQIGVIQVSGVSTQIQYGKSFWQSCKKVGMNRWKISLVGGEIIQQVCLSDPVILREDTTAHDVEHDIRKMVSAVLGFF